MKSYKIWIGKNNDDVSKLVQEHAFKLGYEWLNSSSGEVKFTDSPSLYMWSDRTLCFSVLGFGAFTESHFEEITIAEFLKLVPKKSVELLNEESVNRYIDELRGRVPSFDQLCMITMWDKIKKLEGK